MLLRRLDDRRIDAEPVAHHADVAERHAGLHHAERPGVHTEQQHLLRAAAVARHIQLVRRACVLERVVNATHGRREAQARNALRERTADVDERRH
jgi:hypothetical protein